MSGESGGTGVGPAVLSLVTGQVKRFLPRLRVGNLDDRDPDAIREMLPGMWLLITAWFRPDVRGLHHIPAKGPALIVGNHTGGSVVPALLLHTTMNLGFWLSPVLYTAAGPYWVMVLFVFAVAAIALLDRQTMLRPAHLGPVVPSC